MIINGCSSYQTFFSHFVGYFYRWKQIQYKNIRMHKASKIISTSKFLTHNKGNCLSNYEDLFPQHYVFLFYLYQPITSTTATICWNCGRTANETCSGCNLARYCSQFCQHKDWELHHKVCSVTPTDSSSGKEPTSRPFSSNMNGKNYFQYFQTPI